MMRHARLLRILIALLGAIVMTTSNAGAERPAEPMRGPDFAMEKVASWTERPGGESLLVLGDGSRWRLDPRRADYAQQVTFITRALQKDEAVFLSGHRAGGVIERTAAARKLAVQKVATPATQGRYAVLFHGPPSIYYLRTDRPGAADALALLQRSAAGDAFLDRPDLLVGIDTVASEIILVRALR